MSKRIIIATFGFVLVLCVTAQVVAVNNVEDHKKVEASLRAALRA